MRLIVLGAAAGGGIPQWNANNALGRRAFARDPAVPWGTQTSVVVSADGVHWALIGASPDLRSQILATPALHPSGPENRTSPIAAVALVDGNVDSVAGLLSLRERQPFALYATPRVLAVLAANPMFGALAEGVVTRRPLALDTPVEIVPGVIATAFAVPGKVPLYMENASDPLGGTEPGDVVGFALRTPDGRKRAYVVPSCAALTDALRRRLDGADLLLFDGTFYTETEMIDAGEGTKTAARMGHMPITGEHGSLAAFANSLIARKLYIHVNNTNPVWALDAPERAALARAGWEVAMDGLEIRL